MNAGRVEIARTINGEPMLSPDGMSLLFGVDTELVTARCRRDPVLPAVWIDAGRRRAAEFRSVTGHNDMLGSLTYWAAKERNATIVEDGDAWYMQPAPRRGSA